MAALAAIGATYEVIATQQDARRFPPPGEMVDARGYRLHMVTSGMSQTGPTVILVTGLGLSSSYMNRLQEQVAAFARVVTYDRLGIGWSDPPPAGQSHDAYFASPRFGAGMRAEMSAFDDLTFPQVRAIASLGATPLAVLTAGTTAELVPVQVELHEEYARLSTNSVHRIVPGASHAGMVTRSEYLPAVISSIQQVLEAAKSGQPLPEK
jgi:pimeloyl-ACP methyl ester carboxylesterase